MNNLCVDIDECGGYRNPCGTEKICVNYYGGYSCIDPKHCWQGMTHDTTINRCADVDEETAGMASNAYTKQKFTCTQPRQSRANHLGSNTDCCTPKETSAALVGGIRVLLF